MEIDHESATPVYEQVAGILRGMIKSGEIPPDRPLPSVKRHFAALPFPNLISNLFCTQHGYPGLLAGKLYSLSQVGPIRSAW